MKRVILPLLILSLFHFSCKESPVNQSEKFDAVGLYFSIDFYTVVNGDTLKPIFKYGEKLFTEYCCGPGEMEFDENSNITPFFASIISADDKIVFYMPDETGTYYLDSLSFRVGDIKDEFVNEETIDLGSHEISFRGVYFKGKINDPDYNFSEKIQLSINSNHYQVEAPGNFIIPAPNLNSYTISFSSDVHETETSFLAKEDLILNNNIHQIADITLKDAIYSVNGIYNFISPDGSINPPSEVEAFLFLNNHNRIISSTGTYSEGIKLDSYLLYNPLIWVYPNTTIPPHYSIAIDTLEIDTVSKSIFFNTNLYESSQDSAYFFKEIQNGESWSYKFVQNNSEGITDYHRLGELSWKLTDVSDSSFIIVQEVEVHRLIENPNSDSQIIQIFLPGERVITDSFYAKILKNSFLITPLNGEPEIDIFQTLNYSYQTQSKTNFLGEISLNGKGSLASNSNINFDYLIFTKSNYGITYLKSSTSTFSGFAPMFGPIHENLNHFELIKISE